MISKQLPQGFVSSNRHDAKGCDEEPQNAFQPSDVKCCNEKMSKEMFFCQCDVFWCELQSFRTHDVGRSTLHIIYVILFFCCFLVVFVGSLFLSPISRHTGFHRNTNSSKYLVSKRFRRKIGVHSLPLWFQFDIFLGDFIPSVFPSGASQNPCS